MPVFYIHTYVNRNFFILFAYLHIFISSTDTLWRLFYHHGLILLLQYSGGATRGNVRPPSATSTMPLVCRWWRIWYSLTAMMTRACLRCPSLPRFSLWTDIHRLSWRGEVLALDLPASLIGWGARDVTASLFLPPSLRCWLFCPLGDEESARQARPPLVAWIPGRDCRLSPRCSVSFLIFAGNWDMRSTRQRPA